jgi:TolB-like protein
MGMTEPSTQVPSFPDPSSARFELRCWGEFRLFDRLHGAECLPPRRKAQAIIAYLAAHGGASINRERLAGLLWSERGDQQARASLRQTLLELRPYVTEPARLLVIERYQVHLDVRTLTSDLARIEALARANDLDGLSQALAEKGDRLYGGLDGLDPAFDEWLALERRVQQDRLLALGAAAAARGLQCGVYEAATHLATELQALDETNETVAQIGMQADHARGDCSAVGRRYRRLCEALKQDLGVTPSRETETLFRALTGLKGAASVGREPARVTEAVTSPAHIMRPALAVLPFVNRSGLAVDDVFADGIVEDIAAALSANRWMTVVAASAAATYRKGTRDLRQIGRDLAVRYLLEGNVRRVGEDLRVTAQLVDADSGDILCTQKFDRPLVQLSALQEDLVSEVATHLRHHLERAELRPVWYFNNPTRSGWEASVAEQRRAVEIAPNDGLAYATLAFSQSQLLHYLSGDNRELEHEIVDNIRRAQALDPDNPLLRARCAGALIGLGRAREALPLAERGVAQAPHDGAAHFILGSALARLGRSDEALAELDAAERLAPDTIWAHRSLIFRSVAHLQAGRLDEALEAADRSLRLVLGPDPLVQSMLCLAKLNRWDGAREALRDLRETDPQMSRPLVERLVRYIHGGSSDIDDYVAMARRIWDEAPSEPKSA